MANWYPTVEALISLIGVKPEDRGLSCTKLILARNEITSLVDSELYCRCGEMADATDLKSIPRPSCMFASQGQKRTGANKSDYIRHS